MLAWDGGFNSCGVFGGEPHGGHSLYQGTLCTECPVAIYYVTHIGLLYISNGT
jgi:hypothetical protein